MFELVFTDGGLEDLQHFRKAEQQTIYDAIVEQLAHEPLVETRNRKPLRPNELAAWEVRIGSHRVFYDVDEKNETVTVKAIGKKEQNKLFFRGKEYKL